MYNPWNKPFKATIIHLTNIQPSAEKKRLNYNRNNNIMVKMNRKTKTTEKLRRTGVEAETRRKKLWWKKKTRLKRKTKVETENIRR